MTNTITKEAILSALSKVQEPELHKDLVTLNMVRELEINGDQVFFTIMLTTPACPLRSQIEREAKQAVMTIEGVKSVSIKMDSDVPNDGRMRGLVNMPIRNAIAVGSGKGGVGKSTVSVNIAVALAQSGARVGLMDADIYGPNTPTMLGVEKLPPPQGQRLIPAIAYGIKMISMGLLVKPGQPLIWRGPMLNSAIRQFLGDVEWGELDYLIVDLPPGTGDAALVVSTGIALERRGDRDSSTTRFARRCRVAGSICSARWKFPSWALSRTCPIWICPMARAWISLVRVAESNWRRQRKPTSSAKSQSTRTSASAVTPGNRSSSVILNPPPLSR